MPQPRFDRRLFLRAGAATGAAVTVGGLSAPFASAAPGSLEGPFTEYPNNPIVANSWQPHYSVSHVASPHVMWHASTNELWLYFHGENTTTRLARSKDGINFTYDKVVLSTSMLPSGTTETSYARVFPHELPSRGAHYVMVFMLNNTTNHRDIHWGWSADGRTWTYVQQPLLRHSDVGAVNVGGPHLPYRDNSAYVVYNKDKGGTALGLHRHGPRLTETLDGFRVVVGGETESVSRGSISGWPCRHRSRSAGGYRRPRSCPWRRGTCRHRCSSDRLRK
ncbi:hypothetical protein SAMN05446589_8601 [Streptomyces sp. OV198]|uniref:hypothetical protein n=1 Tax=Streptomyces sp. OV198 TaxID=1882787 RepID=UPI000BD53592|nr:hypothetical protein [Streptomyces sp. OV198]SOE79568.1 hypothetical protein SAMN05446589_8601 [Streptomyces sp. OV198]